MKERILDIIARVLCFEARQLAKRLDRDVTIIGVTGSSGKTSTKEAIGYLIRGVFGDDATVSYGNLNTEIGLPLVVLGFKSMPSAWLYPWTILAGLWRGLIASPSRAYVLEYAVDHPDDMDRLVAAIRPRIAVITSLSPVHMENFSSYKDLVKEKMKLARALPSDGTLIANGDNNDLFEAVNDTSLAVKRVFFGRRPHNHLQLKEYKLHSNRTDFTVRWQNGEESYAINALGEQHIMAVMPSIVIAKLMKIDTDSLKKALRQYKPLPGRGNIVFGFRDTVIINDTYNANPLSTEKMLEVLRAMPGKRKVAVLGDMAELGEYSVQEHKRILTLAKSVADMVVTVGPKMSEVGLADHAFLTPQEAAVFLKDNLSSGMVLGVKGSQSMRMEKVVEAIMLDSVKAAELLPRQTSRWKKIPFKAQ